jgi:hypothetical protein
MFGGFNVAAEAAAEKSSLMSSRAKRGICFFANPKKKADSSGKPRPRIDTFGIFPQPATKPTAQRGHGEASQCRFLRGGGGKSTVILSHHRRRKKIAAGEGAVYT